MSIERNYAWLGLFIAIALIAILGTAVLFIQRLRTRDAIAFVTYTTENVTGLDVSSPVRYLGVSVGRVTGIRVDPRAGTVEIDFEVFTDRLTQLGVNVGQVRERIIDIGGVFPNLRTQLMGNPVTGEAYLVVEKPKVPPPVIELGFRPNRPYIPSMPSTIATVQDRLPALLERAEGTLQTLREIIAKLPASMDRSDRFFTNVERIMQESQLPALSADSRQFFTTTSAQIDRMTSELDGLIGKEGTLGKFTEETQATLRAADLPATTKATRDAAHDSRLASDDLRRSLPAIRDSLEQLRELARLLEAQPESVVYGPRPAGAKHP
jgi:ABC-type transporter Mla subunit MlaD